MSGPIRRSFEYSFLFFNYLRFVWVKKKPRTIINDKSFIFLCNSDGGVRVSKKQTSTRVYYVLLFLKTLFSLKTVTQTHCRDCYWPIFYFSNSSSGRPQRTSECLVPNGNKRPRGGPNDIENYVRPSDGNRDRALGKKHLHRLPSCRKTCFKKRSLTGDIGSTVFGSSLGHSGRTCRHTRAQLTPIRNRCNYTPVFETAVFHVYYLHLRTRTSGRNIAMRSVVYGERGA